MDTVIVIVCVLLVLFGVWASIPKPSRAKSQIEPRQEKAVMLPPRVPQHEVEAARRRAEFPAQYERQLQEMAQRRRLLTSDVEVVDGELVDTPELEAPKRKLLRG